MQYRSSESAGYYRSDRILTLKQAGRGHRSTGFPVRSYCHTDMLAATLLSVLVLAGPCVSAPQVHGSERSGTAEGSPSFTMINPFGAGEEAHSLRQSYIKGNLNDGQMSPPLNTWEQEVFFLFSLHDYDKSGQMDGLEMMKLLSHFLSHHSLGPQSADSVVSMVDFLLQTQDLNQDGMLDPSELLSPPAEPRRSQPRLPAEAASQAIYEGAPANTAVWEEEQQGDVALGQETAQELSQQGEEAQGEQKDVERDPPLSAENQMEQESLQQGAGEQEEMLQERQEEEVQDKGRGGVPVHEGQPEM